MKKMVKISISAIVFFSNFIFGSEVNISKLQEYEIEISKLKQKLDLCKQENYELQNSPQNRLLKAKKFFHQKEYEKALVEYKNIIDKYPGSDEYKISKKEYKKVKNKLEKIKSEKARIKALGYKAIKAHIKFKINDVKMNFQKISIKRRWTFDSYGREWYYRDAEKGNSFIVATVKISSDKKNPKLPIISAYEMKDGVLHYIRMFTYKFRRWSSYGTYLGNEADFKNDFAYTKSIPFTLAVEVEKSVLKNPIFIVASKIESTAREYNRFSNPPVSYTILGLPKNILSIEDFENDNILIKIFNKKKLK